MVANDSLSNFNCSSLTGEGEAHLATSIAGLCGVRQNFKSVVLAEQFPRNFLPGVLFSCPIQSDGFACQKKKLSEINFTYYSAEEL
jgi:hypothetical protein